MSNNAFFSKKVCYTVQNCRQCGHPITFLQRRHQCHQCRQTSCGQCSERTVKEHGTMCPFCVSQKIDPNARSKLDHPIDGTGSVTHNQPIYTSHSAGSTAPHAGGNNGNAHKLISLPHNDGGSENRSENNQHFSEYMPSDLSKTDITGFKENSVLLSREPHSEIQLRNLQMSEGNKASTNACSVIEQDCANTHNEKEDVSQKRISFVSVEDKKSDGYSSLQLQPQMRENNQFTSMQFSPQNLHAWRQHTYSDVNEETREDDKNLKLLKQQARSCDLQEVCGNSDSKRSELALQNNENCNSGTSRSLYTITNNATNKLQDDVCNSDDEIFPSFISEGPTASLQSIRLLSKAKINHSDDGNVTNKSSLTSSSASNEQVRDVQQLRFKQQEKWGENIGGSLRECTIHQTEGISVSNPFHHAQNYGADREFPPVSDETQSLPTDVVTESDCFNIPPSLPRSLFKTENARFDKRTPGAETTVTNQFAVNRKSPSHVGDTLGQSAIGNSDHGISKNGKVDTMKHDVKAEYARISLEPRTMKTKLGDLSDDQHKHDIDRTISGSEDMKSKCAKTSPTQENRGIGWTDNLCYSDSLEIQSNQPLKCEEIGCNDDSRSGYSESSHLHSGDNDGYDHTETFSSLDENGLSNNHKNCHHGCPHYHRQQNTQLLEQVIANRGLEIRDVLYDGNCMFRAIIDQLHIQGDLSYSSGSLRMKAVDYLRKNPKHEDGTHLESFLLSKTWEQYLNQMAQDGEWGDHMMLNAIVNVTGRSVIVFSSENEVGQTTIEPNNGTKKGDLCIGHVGQSHFVSLRPRDWRTSWHKNLTRPDEESGGVRQKKEFLISNDFPVDDISGVPTSHLTFLLKNVLSQDCFQICFNPNNWDLAVEKTMQSYKYEIVGSAVEGLEARLIDLHKQVSYISPTEAEIWCISNDNHVLWPDEATGKPSDIIAETEVSHPGYTRLAFSTSSKYYTVSCSNTSSNKSHIKIIPFVLHISSWPPNALEWITRDRRFSWPTQSTIRSIVSAGCHVVPSPHINTPKPDSDFFISFGAAEKIMSEDISRHQQHCYHIFTNLLDWQMKGMKNLTRYHLKTVFYYASEEIPPQLWEQNPGACLLYMVEMLLEYLENRNLPHYFIKENNLIDYYSEMDIREAIEKVTLLRKFPVMTISYLAEAHSLPDTDIVQPVMEDFECYKSHKSLWISANEVFLPITVDLIRTTVLYAQYVEAINLAKRSYDELVRYFTDKSFGEFIMRIISGGPTKQVWFFSLAADLMMGSSVLRHLAVTQEKKTLRDILGGEDRNELGDIAIPVSLLSYNSISFGFVNDIAVLLYNLGRYSDSAHYFKCCRDMCRKAMRENESKMISDPNFDVEKQLNYECMKKQQVIMNIMWLSLQWLWYVYCMTNQSSQFINEMDEMEKVCESLSQPRNYEILAEIWEELGYKQKAALARSNQLTLESDRN